MKNKAITILPLIALFIILLCVCGVNYFNRHKHDKDIAFAKNAAAEYISEKYSFEAEILDRNTGLFAPYFDDDYSVVSFNAEKNGRNFHIIFTKTEGKVACYDNYQLKDIYSAAEKYICERFPKGKVVDMELLCQGSSYNGFTDKDSIFDGENTAEFLEKCYVKLKMVFYDTRFSKTEIDKVIPCDSLSAEFASFDTMEHMDEYLNNEKDSLSYFHLKLEKYAPYITDYIKTYKNEVSGGYDITILENDEFRYAYFPVEPRKLVTRADITAEPMEKSKVAEIFTKHGEEKALGKPLSKEYYFDSIFGDVWVYYPLERLDGYDVTNIGLAWFSSGGMSNNRNIEKAQICGDYAVFNMPFGEDYFMLVDTSGLEDYVPNYD